jgi:signal transduction histidine kinase
MIANTITLTGAILGVCSLWLFSHLTLLQGNVIAHRSRYTIIGIFILCLCLIIPGYIIKTAEVIGGSIVPHQGPFYIIFALTLITTIFFSLKNLISSYRLVPSIHKDKHLLFLISFSSFCITALIFSVILPFLGAPEFNAIGIASSVLFVAGSGYGLLTKHIFAIPVVVKKISILTIIFIAIGGIYIGFIMVLPQLPWPLLLVSALVITYLSFPYINKVIRKYTNHWFFADTSHYTHALLAMTKELEYIDSISQLNEFIVQQLSSLFHAEYTKVIMAEKVSPASSDIYHIGSDRFSLWIPLFSEQNFIATIYISEKKSGERYTQKEAQIAATWVHMLSLKLRHILLFERLRHDVFDTENKLKKSEDERSSLSEQQETLIVDIAHNLQTPLTILKGEIYELEKNHHDVLLHRSLSELSESVEKISSFITRLVSAGYHTQQRYSFTNINISQHVNEIAEYVGTNIEQEEDVSFHVDIQEDLEVYGDKHALEELVINLLSNSLKYRDANRHCSISLSLKLQNQHVVLTVRDTGIGISQEHQKKIFKRWFRVHNDMEGDGIGLAAVHDIARAHHATITLDSELGKGTCIAIHVPQKK